MKFHFTLSPITPARTARYGTYLLPRHEMVLNCPIKFTKILESYSRSNWKKFKHMNHIQQTNLSKTSTLSYKSRVFTLNALSYTIKLTYIN